MKRVLERVDTSSLFYYSGGSRVEGANPSISNATNIVGNCTTITGDCVNIIGNVSMIDGAVDNIEGDVTNIHGSVTNVVGIVTNISGHVSGIVGTVTNLSGNVSGISGDPSNILGNCSFIYGDVSNLVGNVSNLIGDVNHICGVVSNIVGDVTKIKGDVSNLSGSVSLVEGDISLIKGNTTNIVGVLTNVSGDITLSEISPEERSAGYIKIEELIGREYVVPLIPVAEFAFAPPTGPYPLEVIFSDLTSNDPVEWLWNFNGTDTSVVQNPTFIYLTPGTYSPGLIAGNVNGSSEVTKIGGVSVDYLPPVADFDGTPVLGTSPLIVTFTDLTAEYPTSWLWDFGDGSTSGVQSPVHEYTIDGVFDVTLTVSNPAGPNVMIKPAFIEVLP